MIKKESLVKMPVGLCVLPLVKNRGRSVSYPAYMNEILSHAGLCYTGIDYENLPENLGSVEILITVGETEFPDDMKKKLASWVKEGGAWISVGGVCGMSDLLGARILLPSYKAWDLSINTLGEGYFKPLSRTHPIVKDIKIPLHFFNGISVYASRGKSLARALDSHQREGARSALVETRTGKGISILIAPDITGAIVRIQQGIAVTRDGVPAPDGTASVSDGVLKCDDGIVLDWIFDRQELKGAKGLRAFLEPVADQWREIILRSIFYVASRRRIPLPLLWLYPRNLPALAHLSDDTDQNIPIRAQYLLKILKKKRVHSTWCMILPGYPPDIVRSIRDAGHELAMHYNALEWENLSWNEKEFQKQFSALTALCDGQRPVSNKNHYTRWEGDTEFFEWCVRAGIQFDESKGPSKTGNVGFLFGTCHPHFPMDPRGKLIDVLELPFLTQDLVVTVPPALVDALILAAKKHHGIMHLLFHPHHIFTPGVEKALVYSLKAARNQKFEWWKAEQINTWERARRKIRWENYVKKEDASQVQMSFGEPLEAATILWLAPSSALLKINGRKKKMTQVERWGFPFHSVTFNAESGKSYVCDIM